MCETNGKDVRYEIATAGNVKGPRPGMWDMLGRAKWFVILYRSSLLCWRLMWNGITIHRDAWAKQKDLDPYESKWMYVETLKKVSVVDALFK